jgi:nucleotide-binding universal stress UspA family protein
MKKILVPTDFSACADKAVEFAVNLARCCNAELVLLHVGPEFNDRRSQEESAVEKAKLAECERKLRGYGVQVSSRFVPGIVEAAILHAANDEQVDLIVMGTVGENDFFDQIFGSKTKHILRASRVPVTVVPKD